MTPDQKQMASLLLDVLTKSRATGPTGSDTALSDTTLEQLSSTSVSAAWAVDWAMAGGVLVGHLLVELSAVWGQDVDATLFDLRQ